MNIREITAPYNFVPLSGWVYQPEKNWQEQVSQDNPLEDGLSGILELELTAKSPILIGQEQKPPKDGKPGQVRFFEQNGKFAIPGSSLKGMIRNVLEIATFAKMRMVDDNRLSIRDITGGGHLKDIYASRMQNQKAGFLRLRKQTGKDDIVAEIIPCEYAHIRHWDMNKYLKRTDCLFRRGQTVRQKYTYWNKLTQNNTKELPELSFITQKQPKQMHITLAIPRDNAAFRGKLVFTGQISDKCPNNSGKLNKYGKYRDFVFYNKNSNIALNITGQQLQDFRKIHGEGETKDKTPWEDFWKERFKQGDEIPVFYHSSGERVKSIGLAYMYKLAYENSIGETLTHTNPLHHFASLQKNELQSLDKDRDLPELLLGMIDPDDINPGQKSNSLKSRVSFGLMSAIGNSVTPQEQDPTILNGPKPTYFPNYIHQQTVNYQLLRDKPYTTYMDSNAEIRGWKRYPARKSNIHVQPLQGKQKENKKVQVELYPLPEGTQFRGKIRFHNLKPKELGALIWALEWGGKQELMHSLGMGKPFGFGQATLSVKKATVFDNNSCKESSYEADKLKAFTKQHTKQFLEMIKVAYQEASSQQQEWQNSPQLENLLVMANPHAPLAEQGKLKYMHMGMSIRDNEFVEAKKQGMALPDYANVSEPIDANIFPRKTLTKLAQEEYARIEKQKQLEAEKEREQALAKLSPFKRSIEEVLSENPQLRKHLALLKALEAGKWSNPEEQKQIAEEAKKFMQENKLWKETSAKKNPNKDKPYQVTLKVIGFLNQ